MDSVTDIQNKVEKQTSLEEFEKIAQDIANEILDDIAQGRNDDADKKLLKYNNDELDLIFKKSRPLRSLGPASNEKHVLANIYNWREEYYQKLITTSMVGYLYQISGEYTIDDAELNIKVDPNDFMEEVLETPGAEVFEESRDKIYHEFLEQAFKEKFPDEIMPTKFRFIEQKLSEDEIVEVYANVDEYFAKKNQPEKKINNTKLFDFVQEKIQEQSVEEREIIRKFLNKAFKYDPNTHIASSYDAKSVEHDPERKPVTINDNGQPTEQSVDPLYTVVPAETFIRFNLYHQMNFEKIIAATNDLHNVKNDLNYGLIIYDVKDNAKEVTEFMHKYASNTKVDILDFPLNEYVSIGPFKENKKREVFYNKHNKIIEAMLEKQDEDAEIKKQLLNDRIKTKRVKNTKYYGPNDPEFEKYKKENPSILEEQYGIKITDTDDGKLAVETTSIVGEDGTPVDEDGTPLNAVEFDIHNINAKTGKMYTKRMFSKAADKPNE